MPAVAPVMSIMPAVAGVSVPVRLAIPDAENRNENKRSLQPDPEKLWTLDNGKIKSVSNQKCPIVPGLIVFPEA